MSSRLAQYSSTIRFTLVLTVCVALSLWLSHFIPADTFDRVISPILIAASATIALTGFWIIIRHMDGLSFRKAWACALLFWGLGDVAYLVFWAMAPSEVMDMGAFHLSTLELMIGNLMGWFLLLYPTEVIRPGWMTWKKAMWQLLPLLALVALDYAILLNLQPLITLYPIVLVLLLLTHIRAYKIWCEENYSTLDDIDVQWIIRFLVMVVLVGIVYMYMCLTHSHSRGFTQLWLVIFLMLYSSEQILFRKDPWSMLRHLEKEKHTEITSYPHAELRNRLEEWMEKEKPYLNPDFQLTDLGQVLVMNRTYLSHFIHAEYGCTFYQFVNHYRIEEAKRLKLEHPDLKAQEVSARCGFSSPTVFTRTFVSITGMTPREWAKENHS